MVQNRNGKKKYTYMYIVGCSRKYRRNWRQKLNKISFFFINLFDVLEKEEKKYMYIFLGVFPELNEKK